MALRAIFSSHLTVIDNVEVCMNTEDSFNAVTDYHAVKNYVYWLINTRDQEKRDLESMRENTIGTIKQPTTLAISIVVKTETA